MYGIAENRVSEIPGTRHGEYGNSKIPPLFRSVPGTFAKEEDAVRGKKRIPL